MKFLALLLASFFVTGCTQEKDLTSACKLAVKTVLKSPDYVKFEGSDFLKSGIAQPDLEKLYVDRYGSLPPEIKRYLDTVYAEGKNTTFQYWVDLEFSTPEIGRGDVVAASCRFVDRAPKGVSLVKFVVGGAPYSGSDLLTVQMLKGPPNKLTEFIW